MPPYLRRYVAEQEILTEVSKFPSVQNAKLNKNDKYTDFHSNPTYYLLLNSFPIARAADNNLSVSYDQIFFTI
jgi:hypothetical protein